MKIQLKLKMKCLTSKAVALSLKEPHKSYILHLNPSTLNDCLNQYRVYDLQQQNNYLDFMRNNLRDRSNRPTGQKTVIIITSGIINMGPTLIKINLFNINISTNSIVIHLCNYLILMNIIIN